MLWRGVLLISVLVPLSGCAGLFLEKISYSKHETPFTLKATRNYLPKDVNIQPAYTIYEGTEWECKYKTEAGDSICCRDSTSFGYPWKYCLLVEGNQNAYGFVELGTGQMLRWSEGKQPVFIKNEDQPGAVKQETNQETIAGIGDIFLGEYPQTGSRFDLTIVELNDQKIGLQYAEYFYKPTQTIGYNVIPGGWMIKDGFNKRFDYQLADKVIRFKAYEFEVLSYEKGQIKYRRTK